MYRPKIATSNSDALVRVRDRLIHDFGGLHDLVLRDKKNNPNTIYKDGDAPFWALAREIFPIAESIGDLLYNDKTTNNLENFFENDLSKISLKYKKFSAVIPQLFRHSLAHQDELRTLIIGKRKLGWAISLFGSNLEHLNIYNDQDDQTMRILHFDLTVFFNDLMFILDEYISKPPSRKICKIYNSWLIKSFTESKSNTLNRQMEKAKNQIKSAFTI